MGFKSLLLSFDVKEIQVTSTGGKRYFAPDTYGISYNTPIYLVNITFILFQFERTYFVIILLDLVLIDSPHF
jgi:hypothetical protein